MRVAFPDSYNNKDEMSQKSYFIGDLDVVGHKRNVSGKNDPSRVRII